MLPTSQATLVSTSGSEKRNAPKRIPRPPNAFMLYRSDFLKRRAVPPEIERRQQNLSRIAGQCWNTLPDSEKEYWFNQAAIVRAEHRARYPFYKAGPFHGDAKEPSTKAKRRRSATTSGRLVGPTRNRRTKSPYCESMFAALHDPAFSSPALQPSLIFPTTSMSPLSTTASLSPLHLSQLLSPSASPAHTKIDMDMISPAASPSREPCRSLQQYEDDIASAIPHPDLEQLSLQGGPVSQMPLTLPQLDAFSSIGYPLMDFGPLVNDFGIVEALLNPSLISSYPLFDGELNTYECGRL
ncbi:hypothetical protein JVU11DRAFT_1735 [Chiua virens]|nr:hypothetical protein JVU11DRAFT_1735 [Chiua virens]